VREQHRGADKVAAGRVMYGGVLFLCEQRKRTKKKNFLTRATRQALWCILLLRNYRKELPTGAEQKLRPENFRVLFGRTVWRTVLWGQSEYLPISGAVVAKIELPIYNQAHRPVY